jgi:hypothetical protein
MRFDVRADTQQLQRAARNLERSLSNRNTLLRETSAALRDNVRKRIASQNNNSWAKASKWTRAKKNTNRALSGQAKNIRSRVMSSERAEVFYEGISKTTGKSIKITEHHFGYVLPADGQVTSIPILNPAPLRLAKNKNRFFFRWKNDSSIPARKIWPDGPREAENIVEPIALKWLNKMVDRAWK